jgi:glycerophosphoryl diester phosphodiesterase
LAAKSDCEYVHVHYPLCLETDVVERAHAAGLAVDAWTVSDAATVRRLAERGVDAVTVDTRSALE